MLKNDAISSRIQACDTLTLECGISDQHQLGQDSPMMFRNVIRSNLAVYEYVQTARSYSADSKQHSEFTSCKMA
jgi:hypothetical protein